MKKIKDLQSDGRFKTIFSLIQLATFFFVFGNRINAQTVSGPTLVCTSSQYTVDCYCTTTWTCSSNLTLTAGQGTTTATFSANGSGDGWVKAQWGPNSWDDQLVWIGPPEDPTGVSSESGMYGYSGNSYSFAVWPYEPNSNQEPDPVLYVDPEDGTSLWYDYQNYFQIYFGNAGHYEIWATFENSCGESDPVYLNYEGPYTYSTGYEILE